MKKTISLVENLSRHRLTESLDASQFKPGSIFKDPLDGSMLLVLSSAMSYSRVDDESKEFWDEDDIGVDNNKIKWFEYMILDAETIKYSHGEQLFRPIHVDKSVDLYELEFICNVKQYLK